MSLKIFIPKQLFYAKTNCDIYGENKFGEHNCVSYYITCAVNIADKFDYSSQDSRIVSEYTKHFRHLGYIVNAKEAAQFQRNQDVELAFVYDNETPNIYLNKLRIKLEESGKINVFLYDEERILKLQDLNETVATVCQNVEKAHGNSDTTSPYDDTDNSQYEFGNDDMHFLYKLLRSKEKLKLNSECYSEDFFISDVKRYVCRGFEFTFNLMMWILTIFLYQPPFKYVFQHTVLYEHYKEWLRFRNSG